MPIGSSNLRCIEFGERLLLRAFDDIADGRQGHVGVARGAAGLVDELGLVEALDGGFEGRMRVVEVVADRPFADDAGAMAEHLA